MKKVSIILPAHNEEQTIGATIRAFHAVLPEAEEVGAELEISRPDLDAWAERSHRLAHAAVGVPASNTDSNTARGTQRETHMTTGAQRATHTTHDT